MTQVGVAHSAGDFGTDHAVRSIGFLDNQFRIDWRKIAGPATPCVKFGVGSEKGGAATNASIDSRVGFVPISTREGAFRAFFARNIVFFGRELCPPFGFRLVNFFHFEPFNAVITLQGEALC